MAYCLKQERAACERGVTIMPGIGFVVAPSDILGRYLQTRHPDAITLRLAFSRVDTVSRGSLRAMMGIIRRNICVRRNGKLRAVPVGQLERQFDFGAGPSTAAALSWADLITAYRSTGIPNIETYAEMPLWLRGAYQLGAWSAPALNSQAARFANNRLAALWPESPSDAALQDKQRVIVAEVEDLGRWRRSARLTLPDGYRITPPIAVNALHYFNESSVAPGFVTPAQLFGPEFITELPGCSLEDL
jgi:short subunit dehydrogenase-like uncharacterized protein